MLKLSRISRSIITTIYIVIMCLSVYLGVISSSTYDVKVWQIIVYIFAVILLIYFYQVLKRRVFHKTENAVIVNVYKYVYLAVVLIISRIIMVYFLRDTVIFYETDIDTSISTVISDLLVKITGESKYAALIINTTVAYLSAVLIRHIMLGVYENDAIASMTSIVYMLSPAALGLCMEYSPNMYNTLFVLLGIYLIFKIYDNIVLYGYKNKRYVYLAIILAFVVFLDILFGGSVIAWLIPIMAVTFVADYVDSEYINVNKEKSLGKLISKYIKSKQLAIKKSIIVLAVVSAFAVVAIIIGIVTNLNSFEINFKQGILQNVFGRFKLHYILTAAVIIIFEIMGIIMKRKGNPKVSIIKLFSVIYFVIAILYTGATYNLAVYDAIFSMALMLSIGNIYYNREEKIKLLKEKN